MTKAQIELKRLYDKIGEIIYIRHDFLALDEFCIVWIILNKIFKEATSKVYRINDDQVYSTKAYELLTEVMYWYELESLFEEIDIMIDMLDNKSAYDFIKHNLPDYHAHYAR